MSSATGSITGCSSLAPAMSSATTAYPSIAELSKPGSDSGATTSSASTSPSASASATATGGRGRDQRGDDALVLVDGPHQTG